MPSIKYTKQILERAVRTSTNLAQVLKKIGAKSTGSIRGHIKKKIKDYNISTKHFTNCAAINRQPVVRLTADDILVYRNKDYRADVMKLVRALVESMRL